MRKGFWIFLVLGLAVVGGLVFTMFTATESAHLRLEGKILKVRVLPLGGGASLVVLDFRATNPSNVPFVVNSVTLHLASATGEAVEGRTASKTNIEKLAALWLEVSEHKQQKQYETMVDEVLKCQNRFQESITSLINAYEEETARLTSSTQ